MISTDVKKVNNEVAKILDQAIGSESACVMSVLSKGKWHRFEVVINSLSNKTLSLDVGDNAGHSCELQIDQPVGITFEADYNRFLFESVVVGFDPAINEGFSGKIIIEKPAKVETIQRRSYTRVPVPDDLNVKTLFWHRGYTDNSPDVPIDNYWQGSMLDLSAGGTQIQIDKRHLDNFRQDQLIGMQFTPLPYEKPVLVEGQVKYIGSADSNDMVSLGIEFLGLEASSSGRDKLSKIVEAVDAYAKEFEGTRQTAPDAVADELLV